MLLPKLVAKLHALYSQPYFFCRHATEPHINGSERPEMWRLMEAFNLRYTAIE